MGFNSGFKGLKDLRTTVPRNSMLKDTNCDSVFFKFLLRHNRRGALSRVIKKSLCTWWLQYTQLMIWRWPSQITFG